MIENGNSALPGGNSLTYKKFTIRTKKHGVGLMSPCGGMNGSQFGLYSKHRTNYSLGKSVCSYSEEYCIYDVIHVTVYLVVVF